jgi:hypothetical protein
VLPDIFTGNLVTAYGNSLNINIRVRGLNTLTMQTENVVILSGSDGEGKGM